jgi:Na+/H+ antiporter NhaA
MKLLLMLISVIIAGGLLLVAMLMLYFVIAHSPSSLNSQKLLNITCGFVIFAAAVYVFKTVLEWIDNEDKK